MNQADKKGQARKAVVLVSGGLDSSTVLAMAKAEGYDCYSLSFDYGQRHPSELHAARAIAATLGVKEHKVVKVDLTSIGGSALTDFTLDVPEQETAANSVPITYVPARNTLFLSYALAWAEVLGAQNIFIGVNAVDYSGYPDCRPEYIAAFEQMANLATRAGIENKKLTINAPLIDLSKAEIIRRGTALGVDYSKTVSCYQADASGRACGRCESCRLRKQGFADAGIADPTPYQH